MVQPAREAAGDRDLDTGGSRYGDEAAVILSGGLVVRVGLRIGSATDPSPASAGGDCSSNAASENDIGKSMAERRAASEEAVSGVVGGIGEKVAGDKDGDDGDANDASPSYDGDTNSDLE